VEATKPRRYTSTTGNVPHALAPLVGNSDLTDVTRLSGHLLVTLALATAHLAGGHSTWALGRPGMQGVRVAAFWVGLPLIWLGLEARSR
jgi:hypothetical protein